MTKRPWQGWAAGVLLAGEGKIRMIELFQKIISHRLPLCVCVCVCVCVSDLAAWEEAMCTVYDGGVDFIRQFWTTPFFGDEKCLGVSL